MIVLDTQKSNSAFEGYGFKFTGYTEMQKVILLLNQENFNLKPFPCRLAEDWSRKTILSKTKCLICRKVGKLTQFWEMKHNKNTDP